MVYHYPKCICGGNLFPINKSFKDNSGTGRYYKCDKCGAEIGIIEQIYL